jgi:starvation-inducible DNA-binding protein
MATKTTGKSSRPRANNRGVSAELSKVLADTYNLYLKTHNFHWNVTGPRFVELHLLFERQYNEIWLALDEIAERIRALGEAAPGTHREFAALSSIPEPKGVPSAKAMVTQLLEGHAAAAATARRAFAVAEEAGDQVTMDLLTRRIDAHEKTSWMLRSTLG